MTTGPDLRLAIDDPHVASLTIVRPPHNFMTSSLLTGLADELDRLGRDDAIRAVVLRSEGRSFCAGAELSGGAPDPSSLYVPAARIFQSPLPIVAAVQGAAVGGGLGLALAADFRVAAPRARFTANFARLGFHHGFALSATLPAVVGEQRALELLLTGRRIDAEEALAIGLVDRLAPEERLDDAAAELAAELAGSAPLAVRAIRETMRARRLADVRTAFETEAAKQRPLYETADFAEGVEAMAERRMPRFTGR